MPHTIDDAGQATMGAPVRFRKNSNHPWTYAEVSGKVDHRVLVIYNAANGGGASRSARYVQEALMVSDLEFL